MIINCLIKKNKKQKTKNKNASTKVSLENRYYQKVKVCMRTSGSLAHSLQQFLCEMGEHPSNFEMRLFYL